MSEIYKLSKPLEIDNHDSEKFKGVNITIRIYNNVPPPSDFIGITYMPFEVMDGLFNGEPFIYILGSYSEDGLIIEKVIEPPRVISVNMNF